MIFKSLKNQAEQFLNSYKSDNPATYAAAQQAIGGILILDGFIGIDNPFGGKKRSGIFGSFLGIVIGAVLLFSSGFIGNLFGINKLTATTTATVVSVSQPSTSSSNSSGTCTPEAMYTVDGTDYKKVSSSSSSSACALNPGQSITINYDPNNPGAWGYDIEAVKTILKFVPLFGLLVLVGSLFTFTIRLLSIIFGWKILKSGRALAKTLPEGTDISTIKNEVQQNFSKTIFGTNTPTTPKSQTDKPTKST